MRFSLFPWASSRARPPSSCIPCSICGETYPCSVAPMASRPTFGSSMSCFPARFHLYPRPAYVDFDLEFHQPAPVFVTRAKKNLSFAVSAPWPRPLTGILDQTSVLTGKATHHTMHPPCGAFDTAKSKSNQDFVLFADDSLFPPSRSQRSTATDGKWVFKWIKQHLRIKDLRHLIQHRENPDLDCYLCLVLVAIMRKRLGVEHDTQFYRSWHLFIQETSCLTTYGHTRSDRRQRSTTLWIARTLVI